MPAQGKALTVYRKLLFILRFNSIFLLIYDLKLSKMNKTITKGFVLAILMLSVGFTSANAQSATAKQPQYKDFVAENPDADADIKLVSDYVHKLVAGDVDK